MHLDIGFLAQYIIGFLGTGMQAYSSTRLVTLCLFGLCVST